MKETAIKLGMDHSYTNWGESAYLNLNDHKSIHICKGRNETKWDTVWIHQFEGTNESEEVIMNEDTTEDWLIRFVELMKETVK